MTYDLAAAAAATETDESTILKSIEGGKISATKDELGEWRIEPVELHRLYPPITKRGFDSNAAETAAAADALDLEGQIAALISQAGDRLRPQLERPALLIEVVGRRRLVIPAPRKSDRPRWPQLPPHADPRRDRPVVRGIEAIDPHAKLGREQTGAARHDRGGARTPIRPIDGESVHAANPAEISAVRRHAPVDAGLTSIGV